MALKQPWNHWYHITVHTHGSWIRGDSRGWRARHHREHVKGDYKRPPAAGTYDQLAQRSRDLMKREPVVIHGSMRAFVLQAIVDKLQSDRLQVLVAALAGKHLHILLRIPEHRPKHWIGRAKKHSSHAARQATLRTTPGGLWAKRSRAEPITCRHHQLRTFGYVLRHSLQGGTLWWFDQ